MPAFVEPCLATLVDEAPASDNWVHEIKFDGYRLQAHIKDGDVQLLTRSGQDWTHRFGSLAKTLRALNLNTSILDGEVVIEDDKGVSSFVMLVDALKAGQSKRMVYFAFDLLYLDGVSATGATLLDRKSLLQMALKGAAKTGQIRYCVHFEVDGTAMLREACRHGLEGIISKRKDRPYRSGRRDDWLKTKCILTDEFVVAGYLDSTAQPKAVGALVLGYYDHGRLIYAGRVGTGFNRHSANDVWKQLQNLRTEDSLFSGSLEPSQRQGVSWVKPQLVTQIEYRAWTSDRLLRHASFKGLREDKPAKDVHRPARKRTRS
jgi:bifunctional non-homologous end joining protein LigD